MAIMRHSIIFGGVDSADYGLYIGGEGTFNAPKRSVEMVSVPGRNGDIVIDQGSFENVELTYTVINHEANLEDFASQLSDFRNAICSLRGYQRLTDTFHPDEYRMAVLTDEIKVKPIEYATASEWELTFECKPQRWLTSGETSAVVADGGSVTNPTLFDASPLFEVEGFGSFRFGDYEIDLHDPYRGETMMVDPKLYTYTSGASPTGEDPQEIFPPIPTGNEDDVITIKPFSFYWLLTVADLGYGDEYLGTVTVADSGDLGGTTTIISRAKRTIHLRTTLNQYVLPSWARTWTYVNHTVTLNVSYKSNGSHTKTVTYSFGTGYRFVRNPSDLTHSLMHVQYTEEIGGTDYEPLRMWVERLATKGVSIDSTVFILGHPTYIDCELGEAYMIEDGEYKSLNTHIDLGSDLPKLAPGTSTFDIDGTITELKMAPRWWKI